MSINKRQWQNSNLTGPLSRICNKSGICQQEKDSTKGTGVGVENRRYLMLVNLNKQTNKRQRHFALSLGSKLTQLCLPCNPQASKSFEVACLGLSLLPGEAKESVLHSAATSFTLSSWGLEYRHLDWEFIFPNLHSRCTTLPPVTGCFEQHPKRHLQPHPLLTEGSPSKEHWKWCH